MVLPGVLIGVLTFLPPHIRGNQVSVNTGCCHVLENHLPGRVSWPGSPTYDLQQSTYYSAGQTELQPQCRVSPTTGSDISQIMKIATHRKCKFAVRSGGHMAWTEASNIGGSGFTVDLQSLNKDRLVSVSEDRSVVSFSSGARWRDVYGVLAPYNLTTVGGRVGDVGVGGFLLGGGIGFLTAKHGFGSDNIVNYEVVIADGSIVNANATHHPDLYWALKLGSTNFGIVTRFDMTTFPQENAWGGSQFFTIDDAPVLLEKLVTFTRKSSNDPKGFYGLTLAWVPAQQSYIVWTLQTYLEPTPYPPLWSEFREVTPLVDLVGVKSLLEITEDFQEADPGKQARALWSSMSFVPDAQFHLDIHKKGVELFEPYHSHAGVQWAVGVQPLPRGASAKGNTPSVTSDHDEDLWIMILTTAWLDPKDNTVMTENSKQLIQWAETEAARRGLFRPFVYMNYAGGFQDVIERSVGTTNLKRMMEVSGIYDPLGELSELWVGGYKLPPQKREHDATEL